MISCTPSSLHEYTTFQPDRAINPSHHYKLTWRQAKLLVGCSQQVKQPYLPSLDNKDWLVNCLTHTPMQQVGLDLAMGAPALRFWAEASLQAEKAVFLRLPSSPALPHKHHPLSWWLKCCLDRLVATLLLLVLSPLMLALGVLLAMDSSEPVFTRDWRIGERGKLFQVFKFRTNPSPTGRTPHPVGWQGSFIATMRQSGIINRLKSWMRQSKLDEFPQLVNVLQGDMSLVGPRPLALQEATQLSVRDRQRLNALPGLTGIWREEPRSVPSATPAELPELTLGSTHHAHSDLYSWSLWKDLQALFLAVSGVIR